MGWFHLIFFASGAAGLVYEVVWTRALADVVGSTAVSLSAVLSVFLSGLALGAFLFGRGSVRGRRAVERYVHVEVGVAVTAAASSLFLFAMGGRMAAMLPAGTLGGEVLGAVALSAALFLAPTLLMGGSLPVLIQGVTALGSSRDVAVRLYGWNTLGGAAGAVAAGFALIWLVGLTATAGVAVALNLAAAGGAWALRGRVPFLEAPPAEREAAASSRAGPAGAAAGGTDGAGAPAAWLALAAASGVVVLGYEVLWGRLARFLLGDRTMALSAVLGIFVAALGAAALLAPALARRAGATDGRRGTLLVGVLLTAGGLAHAALLPAATATASGGALAPFFAAWPAPLARLTQAALLMGPPVLVLGLVFPVLLWSAREALSAPGRTVGTLYLVNTLGAVAGALGGTFLLSRWTGTVGGFLALSAAVAALGTGLLFAGGVRARGRVLATAAWMGAGGVALFLPADLAPVRPGEFLLERHEDEYGVQTLTRSEAGTLRMRNNRVSLVFDLGHPQTARAQQMSAHLAVLLTRDPARVLNVGTGYGITAGTFTLYDSVEEVRTVELLPFVLAHQDDFAEHNFGYVSDPRVRLVRGDGRHALLASAEPWDVVSVNVLDPYLPGSSSLYTVDFWEEARARLRPGGVFTQLFWGEDVDVLVRGITSVFPRVLLFPEYGGTSYTVVAFRDPGPDVPPAALERVTGRALGALSAVAGGPPGEVIPLLVAEARRIADGQVAASRGGTGPLHTDDRPILEYRWAHGVPGVSPLDSPLVVW